MALVAVLQWSFDKVRAVDEVRALAITHSEALMSSIEELNRAAISFRNGRGSTAEIRKRLTQTRNAYKKVEFLLEYHFPGYVEEHINGAPLLHPESDYNRPIVVEPEGLQVLDELVYSDEVEEKRLEVSLLTQKLATSYQSMHAGFVNQKLTDREFFEAARLEIVRIFALGLTGFDTPGSLNALEEAEYALRAMHRSLKPYFPVYNNDRKEYLETLLSGAGEELRAGNFDEFDRLAFLKNYLNPLYKELLEMYLAVDAGVSRSYEDKAWNFYSENIFAKNFLNPYYYSERTPVTDSEEMRALGKKLFFDPVISTNGSMSCATCHDPGKAYTDGFPKSPAMVEGMTVLRNAPTLLNAVYSDRYFYDLRAFDLKQQAQNVILNHLEFQTGYDEILEKINANKEYRKEFAGVFGKGAISREEFSGALVSFVSSLQALNSDFDRYVRGETGRLGPEAKKGFNLFMGKAACGTCHFAPTFAGLVPPLYVKNESEILGVLEDPKAGNKKLDEDKGRAANKVYSEMAWIYEKSFKTVSVRNVEHTAPYFHNGAYQTLEEVLDFYNNGGGSGLGLEVTNQTLSSDSLKLTAGETRAIIAFMKTLSDKGKPVRSPEMKEKPSIPK